MQQKKIGKILFVVPSFSNGGAERVVSVLASSLAEKNIETHCIVYYKAKNEYDYSSKIKIHYLAGDGEESYKILGMKKKVSMLRRMILRIEPTYIIPFLPQVGFHVFMATLGRRYKIIQTVRNNPRTDPKTTFERAIRNLMVVFSWRSFVQNNEQFAYFPRFIQKKLVIIPNPISDTFFKSNHVYNDEVKEIISLGRLSEQKNFELLIKVAEEINKKYPNIHFSIYGDGPLKKKLQEIISKNDLDEVVSLKGRTNNSSEALNNSDVFVLSSNYEGMPNALLEAMAIGLPCISTDCPTGPADIISNGVNGILVPVNDQDALIVALEQYISSEKKLSEYGNRAREYVQKRYSSDVIAAKFLREVLLISN